MARSTPAALTTCLAMVVSVALGPGAGPAQATPAATPPLTPYAPGQGGTPLLAGGGGHSCEIRAGGRLWCWGWNSSGQLGDGSVTQRTTPVTVTGMAGNVTAVAAGYAHTCALQSGALKCWGSNAYGQLGSGGGSSTTPLTVTGMSSSVTGVIAGRQHTCGIQDGALKCWGYNDFGQLGDGTTTHRATPVTVTGMISGVTAMAAGNMHTCAIQNGTLKCWGGNGNGQLGDGTTTQRTTPVTVTGMISGVTAMAAGYAHTCAIQNGALKCWGSNANGQLGDGTTTQRTTPVTVTGMTSGVTAVAAGYAHTCAIHNGTPKCWGGNGNGQLGDGTTTQRLTPASVLPGEAGDWDSEVILTAGDYHSLARKGDGCLYAWGRNTNGQLGDGTTTQRLTPALVRCPAVPPAAFRKTAPANGATAQPTNPTLSWTAPATGTVDHYRYCRDTMSGCAPTIVTTATSATLSGLTPGTTYYWQARACADADCEAFTDADDGHWSFTVAWQACVPIVHR